MRVGFIALGKLGLPCAVVADMHGHDVMGFDLDVSRMNKEAKPELERGPENEGHYNDWLSKSNIRFGTMDEVCRHSEIIFVSVQTPHVEKYEGITRLPEERVDFDYRALMVCMHDLASCIEEETVVVVISTVLPGTMRSKILPLCHDKMKVCYNPFFIAMGTTMWDFVHPEFILFGNHDPTAAEVAQEFYKTICTKTLTGDPTQPPGAVTYECPPFYSTTVENAELIKVSYNTYISQKIAFVNTLMEICHKMPGCDVDAVTQALHLGTSRLISTKYLKGGMGDGGGCHPRDNIALSWLARELDLSHDLFEDVMKAREHHSEFLADLMEAYSKEFGLPMGILGTAFKKESNLEIGSPSLLLEAILLERGRQVMKRDHYIEGKSQLELEPAVWLIGCNHEEAAHQDFPAGSVVLDPWRMIFPGDVPDTVEYVPIGVGPSIGD